MIESALPFTRLMSSWLSHSRTLHQLVELVRTGVTPSPARLRSKLCPPTLISSAASSRERNRSKISTHGSRLSTVGSYSASDAARLKVASMSPLLTAFGPDALHTGESCMPHVPHECPHARCM